MGAQLDLSSQTIATSYVQLLHTGHTSGLEGAGVGHFVADGNGEESVLSLDQGRVGVGTESPAQLLHVKGTGSIAAKIESTDNNSSLIISSDTDEGQISGLYFDAATSTKGSIIYNHNATQDNQNMRFVVGDNANTALHIEGDGFIGINDTDPDCQLHVTSATNDSFITKFEHTSSGDTSSAPYGISVLFSGGAPDNDGANPQFIDCSDTGGMRFRVYSSGDIAADDQTVPSDERLKENIVDCTPKLDDVNKIKVRNFNWRECDVVTGQMRHSKNSASVKRIGVIAQEFESIFPALVSEQVLIDKTEEVDELKRKSVKWSALVPILIKSIQELSAKVDALENNNKQGDSSNEQEESTANSGGSNGGSSSSESSGEDNSGAEGDSSESSESTEEASGSSESASDTSEPGADDGDETSGGSGSDSIDATEGGSGEDGNGAQGFPEGEPSDEWTKDELKAYMEVNEIAFNSGDTKQDLLDKIGSFDG